VKTPKQIIDVFKLRIALKRNMLVDMYLDARRTKRKQASPAAAEVSEELSVMESTLDFG